MLYVQMNKALYGLLQSALLFYKKLQRDLEGYGFVINPYDPCVANTTINGHQMTVAWHVDDLKVSHKDLFEITKFATYLSSIYGPKLSVKRGKVHDYLGMDLDYTEEGSVKVSMVRYTGKVLRDFPERITGSAASPAQDHLFKVRDESDPNYRPLTEDLAQSFHHTTVQLLFMCS